MLLPCLPHPTPGAVLRDPPGIEVFEDVIYRPLRGTALDADPSWGIYDARGALLDAAAYRRGPGEAALIGQSAHQAGRVAATLDGIFLYGGPVIDHFGHFILSSLARLWPLVDPSLRASLDAFPIVVHAASDPRAWFRRPYVAEVFGALGLRPERFVTPQAPARIRRLIVPRPSLVEMHSVYPAFLRMTQMIGHRLGVRPDRGPPVWLSRSELAVGTQGFENEAELEAVLARLGVEIVHPERHSIAEAAGFFAGRPVVAGTIGSAFSAALFCSHPAPIVALSPSPVVNPSFRMLDEAACHSARYFHAGSDHLGIDMERRLWSTFRLRDPVATAGGVLRAMQEGPG